MVEQLRSELQVKVCELRDHEASARSEITDRDKSIARLQQSLCRKRLAAAGYSLLHTVMKTGPFLWFFVTIQLCFSSRSMQSCRMTQVTPAAARRETRCCRR